jgi:hypothetical protein
MYPLAVTQVELPRVQFSIVMSDTKAFNTSWLEVMISSKPECVITHDFSDLTLQMIFDALWTSMNACSKRHIAWTNFRYTGGWRSYLHSVIEETGSPGFIGIICLQVLRHP